MMNCQQNMNRNMFEMKKEVNSKLDRNSLDRQEMKKKLDKNSVNNQELLINQRNKDKKLGDQI